MKTRGVTINPIFTQVTGRLNNTEKLMAINPDKKVPAYNGLNSPVVKGLALVLSTCLSISLSVKSFIIQPELLHDRAPTVNKLTIHKLGINVGEPRARPQ